MVSMPPRKNNPEKLPPRVYAKHGAYWLVDQKHKWHRLGKTWDFEARAEWNRLVSDGAADCRLDVADMLRAYIKHKRGQWKPSTITDYERDAEILIMFFGKRSPRDVSPPMVQRYIDEAAANDRGVRGNREIALLSAAYNFGIPREWCEVNPCSKVDRNPETTKDRRVSIEELDAFIAFATNPKGDVQSSRTDRIVAVGCELAFICAQGKADFLKIKRADMDSEGIHIQRGKTGVRICVGWSPRLIAAKERALALQKNDDGTQVAGMFVISTNGGQQYTTHGWSALFHRVMNKWIKQGGKRFSPHDLRAAGATSLLESGENASNTTGHKLESTLKKHYDRRLERKGKPAA